MSKEDNKLSNNSNKGQDKNSTSFIRLLGKKLFGGKKQQMSIFEEEQMQTPFKTVLNNFTANKVSMAAVIVFLLILAIVLVGPRFLPIDLSYQESSQVHVAPGLDLMKYPKSLEGKVEDISTGPTYSVAIDTNGKLYMWGKTKITETIDLKYVPSGMGKLVQVAAGFDHVVALNEEGQLFAWGNGRQRQTRITPEIEKLDNIKSIHAGYQSTLVLTEDGYTHFFGNSNNNDYNDFHAYQGQIDKVQMTADAVVGLTYDGEVVYLGMMQNSYSNVPENMGKVVEIAATAATMAAVNDQGDIFIWGNISNKWKEANVPELDSKIVSLEGGRYHYTAVTEDGQVVAWGANQFKQSTVPDKINKSDIKEVHSGFYQNYAVTESGEILTWGLKGYVLGSDDLGRDILTRLVNGGRMSMTIGGVAVAISTIIGVLVGSISGYFGGRVDIFLQRLTEMVVSLPFLPFAMILSALIGHSMDSDQKIWLIMVVLGLLSWPSLSRLVRAQVLSVREQEYVTAARAVGVKTKTIVLRHILPNVISVILVSATLDFATSMLTEATLSFLGFGVPAPQPTWGNILYGANNSITIQNYWWRWVFASIILGVCVICINLIGDGLRDAIDPKSSER